MARSIRKLLRRRWPWLLAWVLGLVALASPQHYRNDFHSANEASRIYAALALVDHETLALDPVFDRFFPGWQRRGRPPNMDVSYRKGRYLSDKAPGITLLSVPVIVTLRALGARLSYARLAWLLAFLLSALPTLLFGRMLWHWLRQQHGDSSPTTLVAPALVLATPWLVYSALLFGHALAASLTGMGLLLALGPLQGNVESDRRRGPLLAGLALGGATLVEFPAGLVALVVCVALAADPERRSRLGWLVLGGLGPALVLVTYNWIAFGGPLSFPYGYKAHETLAATHGRGLYGISWPDVKALYGLVLSPQRGLLFGAPWLAAGLAGAGWAAFDQRLTRAWRVALPAGLGTCLLLLSGFADWHGGRALGPRYLLYSLPLWGVGAALLIHRVRRWRHAPLLSAVLAGLALSSLGLALAAHLGFPLVDHRIHNPLFEVVLPVWLEGGPGPTVWRPLPGGALLAAASATGLIALVGVAAARARPRDREAAPRRWLVPAAALGAAALLHLALATLPQTPGDRGRRRVLAERALAHELLDQKAAAQRARQARHKIPRPR